MKILPVHIWYDNSLVKWTGESWWSGSQSSSADEVYVFMPSSYSEMQTSITCAWVSVVKQTETCTTCRHQISTAVFNIHTHTSPYRIWLRVQLYFCSIHPNFYQILWNLCYTVNSLDSRIRLTAQYCWAIQILNQYNK